MFWLTSIQLFSELALLLVQRLLMGYSSQSCVFEAQAAVWVFWTLFENRLHSLFSGACKGS